MIRQPVSSLTLRGLALLFGVLATPLAAQDTRPGVAVLPFENGGSLGQDKENFEALQVGIPAVLQAELARNPGIRLVDRSDVKRLLSEQDLGAEGRVDAATAARIGKLVGARYMVMGSFVDFYGKFRLNARVVDVETSEILKVLSNADPKLQDRKDMYRIIQDVSEQIAQEVKLPPLPAAAQQAMKERTIPTEALTLYSRALVYEERGDKKRAAEFYQKAKDAYPAYTEAEEGLRKMRS